MSSFATTIVAVEPCDLSVMDQYKKEYTATQKVENLELLAKCYYSKNQWPEFLGLAMYLRSRGVEIEKRSTLQQILLLEVLASLRHCQVERARVLLEGVKVSASQWTKEIARIEAYFALFPPKSKQLGGDYKMNPNSSKPVTQLKQEWPMELPLSKIRELDPLRITVPLKSKCKVVKGEVKP